MHFVEEVVVEEFLPTYRSMLAEVLRDRGLTQSEVAALLGISQSAVSKYVHGEVERNERLLADDRLGDLVERLADGLVEGEVTPVQALIETEVLIRQLERGGLLAQLHAEAFPSLAEVDAGPFDVHDPDSRRLRTEEVRSSLRKGLRILENTGGFANLIPAVGSNLVESLHEADGIDDVAAVPGRILDLKGRAHVPGDPEFGVSEHVAGVLLAARAAGSDARATLNLRYEPETIDRLESLGHETVEFDAEAEVEPAVAEALGTDTDADVLYQTGGFGIEPVVYLLGPDAPTVAGVVRDLV